MGGAGLIFQADLFFVATLAGYTLIEESFTIGGANETINFTIGGMG